MISPRPVVYVIGCREWIHEGKSYYKIGRSIHPHNRMKQLKQHFNRKNLQFRFVFETQVDGESEVEKHLHRTFRKQRVKDDASTELFKVDINIIKNELKQLEERGSGTILPLSKVKW